MREVAAKGAPSRFRTLLVFAILLFVGAKIGGLEWSWWWLLLFVPLSYAAHWLDIVLFGRKPKTEKQVEAAIKVASKIEFDMRVVERLAVVAAALPRQALEALALLLEDAEPWNIYAWRESIRYDTAAQLFGVPVRAPA